MNTANKTKKDSSIAGLSHIRLFFSQLDASRKRKIQEEALTKVVKNIWDEGQTLKKQRVQMMGGWTGDLGLALFIPIDWEEIEETVSLSSGYQDIESDDTDSDDDIAIQDDPHIVTSPPILSYAQLHEIHTKGLPPAVTLMTWTRAYSLNRDGDHFGLMMEKVSNYQHTLTVIRTSDGDILGGYADTAWGTQMCSKQKRKRGFFGGGRAFLFATSPDLDRREDKIISRVGAREDDKDAITLYPWTGVNSYSQICDVRRGAMGMGGGGSFGWFVQDNFTTGSSGPCLTFRNPPLTKGDDGHYKVIDMEIYGFTSMSERDISQKSLLSHPSRHSRTISNTSSITSMFN